MKLEEIDLLGDSQLKSQQSPIIGEPLKRIKSLSGIVSDRNLTPHAEPSLHCPIDHDTEPNWYYDCDRNDIS